MIVLLQIFSWLWQWNNFENRLIFGKVKAYKNSVPILGHPVVQWNCERQNDCHLSPVSLMKSITHFVGGIVRLVYNHRCYWHWNVLCIWCERQNAIITRSIKRQVHVYCWNACRQSHTAESKMWKTFSRPPPPLRHQRGLVSLTPSLGRPLVSKAHRSKTVRILRAGDQSKQPPWLHDIVSLGITPEWTQTKQCVDISAWYRLTHIGRANDDDDDD